MGSTIEARLQYLEARDHSYSSDFIRLKSENADLHTLVFGMKREILQSAERIKRMESEIQKLQDDLQEVAGFKANIDDRLGSIEKEAEERLQKLEKEVKNMNDTLLKVNNFLQAAGDKMRTIENRVNNSQGELDVQLEKLKNKDELLEVESNRVRNSWSELECQVNKLKLGTTGHEQELKKLKDEVAAVQENFEDRLNKMQNDVATIHQESKELRESVTDKTKNAEEQVTAVHKNLEDRLNKMQIYVATVHQESNELRESVTDKRKNTEEQVKAVHEKFEDRLNKMQNDVATIHKESKELRDYVMDKMKNTEEQVKAVHEHFEDRLNKMQNDVATIHTESKELRDSVTDKMKNAEEQLSISRQTEKNVQLLMKRRDAISDSYSSVKLKPSKELETGVYTKLDTVVWADSNPGYFNQTSCCLDPPTDGVYVVNVSFCQDSTGELRMYVKRDGVDGENYLGKTVEVHAVCSRMSTFRLKKGQKLWLEAYRVKGDAKVHWCRLDCWLANPEIV